MQGFRIITKYCKIFGYGSKRQCPCTTEPEALLHIALLLKIIVTESYASAKIKQDIMLKKLNRFIYVFLSAVYLAFSFTAQAQNIKTQIALPQKFKEYTLENSMKVFVLEDFSNAPVRIELAVHAGFSAQTPKTAGFFPLYTNLFAKAAVTSHILTTHSVLPQDLADSDFSWFLKPNANYFFH